MPSPTEAPTTTHRRRTLPRVGSLVRAAAAAAALASLGCATGHAATVRSAGSSATAAQRDSNALPRWDLDAVLRSARRYVRARPGAPAWILAWSARDRGPGTPVDDVLVLVAHRGGRWGRSSVVLMQRSAGDSEWTLPLKICAKNSRPIVRLRGRPTVQDADRAALELGWDLAPRGGRVVGGLVEQTWRDVLGGLPPVLSEFLAASAREAEGAADVDRPD